VPARANADTQLFSNEVTTLDASPALILAAVWALLNSLTQPILSVRRILVG